MEKEMKGPLKGHVLLFPFPAQGHTNPIFQFAKRLASKGLKTTLATTIYLSKTMHLKASCKVGIDTISDGYDETGPLGTESGEVYLKRFKEVGSRTLGDIINKYENTCEPITCLVSDAILTWGLDVAKQYGLVSAAFFTQASSVCYIFYHVKQENLSVPIEEPTLSIPSLPLLHLHELPTSVRVRESPDTSDFDLLTGQFSNLEKADWLLFNTFDKLENEVVKLMAKLWRVRTIGPTTPSMYLDKRVEGDTENSLNLFKHSDRDYVKWLNAKETGSVLYVSFGSIAEFGEEQMEELICGVRQSNKDFIWIVRENEKSKLPIDLAEGMLDKGLVVSWCSQLEVLAHDAIGCFLTHCGWNSTLEALSLGVPMVAMPHIWDQITNAKLVDEVWGLGIRPKADNKGMVRREELELCIREVMDGERGKVMKRNANVWRELAKDAVDVGGSSDMNIEEFISSTFTCN